MFNRNDQKMHKETLGHLCRRGVAFVLAAAMSLSLLPATLAVETPITPPTQVTDNNDFPKVEFQTNFVRTEYGTLTGMMELAIRVGPSGTTTDATGKEIIPVPVNFQSIAATLQFNTKLFTPVNWSWEIPEKEGTALPASLELSATNYYDVQLPAMKDDTIPGTGAIAQCGVLSPAQATAMGMSDDVASGDQALLFFKAESYGGSVALGAMTTLAVIRFYINPALFQHISIERDKKSFSAEGYNYNVVFDGKTGDEHYIKTRSKLDEAIRSTVGQTTTVPGAVDPDLMNLLGENFISVDFAVDGDMAKSKSPANMSLHYSAGSNEFYFVPGCDRTVTDPLNDTLETVNVDIDNNPVTPPVPLTAPKTAGSKVLAVDNITNPTDYSYLTNLIPATNITFPVVSQLSFADKGDGRENMVTVVFYDWDDTLIGVLVVPRKDDARALVNEYVRQNMIHPDLRFDEEERNGSTTKTLVNSLTRSNSYRGKYPSTPMEEGGKDNTMDGNRPDDNKVGDEYPLLGSDYPLTNKLDYVFLKRPMEKDETVTTNTWKQQGDETEAVWDYEYPYIYGWALIPDDDLTDIKYTHPENIWTTIGMGELATYTGLTTGAYPELDTGVITANKGASELVATDNNFKLANFDFHSNPQPKGTVYAVKAVYEPGAELLNSSYSYQMISEPYYNKMNNPAAISGAAYSVDVIYERANIGIAKNVNGIARARQLELRQETTTDLRWENAYLKNADIKEQGARTKTTYSTVPVDNVDVVNIQLILSGRHNKVNYYLMEANNASFVTGGTRSDSNITRISTAHLIDNYNYKTADNDTDRIYYQAEYVDIDGDGEVDDDRSGSYGFVLLGTINNLAQKALEHKEGTLTDQNFNNYLSMDNFNDMNLRIWGEFKGGKWVGGIPVSYGDWPTAQKAWEAAVTAAKAAHVSGNDEWWNVEHDLPQFTYHQIQLYVNDYVNSSNGSATLRDADAADKQIISWCNLHEECAASRSGKPTSFAKMVQAVLDEKVAGDAKAVLSLLTLDEAENMAHLRSNERGAAYATMDRLADAFIAAVKGIDGIKPITDTSDPELWDTIQGWILSTPKPTDTNGLTKANKLSKDTAWWNEGEDAPATGSLAALVAAEKKAVETGRDAWINYYRYREAFTDMQTNGVSPQSQWTRITENLVKNIDGEPFDTYEQFKAAFRAAVPLVPEPTPEAPDEYYWHKLQYIMAGDTRTPETDQYAKYWWHNGYSRITDLASLLAAAQQYNKGETAVWEMFDSLEDHLYGADMTQLHFRNGRNGTTDKYTDIEDFKADILAFIQAPGAQIVTGTSTTTQVNNAWNQLQYYLIHKNDDLDDDGVPDGIDLTKITNLTILAEAEYYWWKNGKDGEIYSLTPGVGEDNIEELNEAVYSAAYYGNPKALDQLTVAAAATFRLIPSYAGTEETWGDLTKYDATTLNNLKTKLEALSLAAGEDDYWALTWRQIQHYILTNTYLKADSPSLPTDTPSGKDGAVRNYWWKMGAANPNLVTDIKSDLDTFLEIIDQYIEDYNNGDNDDDAFDEEINLYSGITDGEGSKLNLYGGSEDDVVPVSDYTSRQQNTFRKKIRSLAQQLAEEGRSAADGLDWFVLQYYAISDNSYDLEDDIVSKEDALDYYLYLLEEYEYDSWAPSFVDVPDTTSLLDMAMFGMMAMGPDTTVEIDPDTGIVTVTTVKENYLEEIEMILVVTTVVAIDPAAGTTTTTVITILMDGENNILSETTTTDTVPTTPEEPQEPVCTCGSEDETHAEDCPLYEAPVDPEEPVCTCGSEDETHAEDCPLYEAPVDPEEPVCTCGSEDETHSEDCPLYEAPEEPVEPTEESPKPTESQKPEGSWETMPEIIGNPDMEPEEPEKGEPDPAPGPEEPEPSDTESKPDIPGGLPEIEIPDGAPEAIVVETPPPLGTLPGVQSRSAPTVYNKLTTKMITLNRRSETGQIKQIKQLTKAGGAKMKLLNIKRISSPPGYGGVPLLLRTELTERRRAL